MYVCPDCRGPLVDLRCSHCGHQYPRTNGFPVLLPNDERYSASQGIVDTYNAIYLRHSNVWQNQGRSPAFILYFASLLNRFAAKRFLEIGCGEGALLGAISAEQKYATELSAQALRKALNTNTHAHFCIALGERLPFSDEYFDLIASVGVMEHLLDDRAATDEIWRVLKGGGHYVVLIHVHLTARQSLLQKFSEYVYPRPHPVRLAKWLMGKIFAPVHQPIQNKYTFTSAKICLEESGFSVVEVIQKANAPTAPLIGPHVIIFVCKKKSTGEPKRKML